MQQVKKQRHSIGIYDEHECS